MYYKYINVDYMVEIFRLLSKKSTSEVLRHFLLHPTKKTHAQKLGKDIKISRIGILESLHALLGAGILEAEDIGRVRRYSLRRDEPVVKQLKVLLTLESVMSLLEKLKGSGVEAYLYGSAARGEDIETSDVDLLLIGDRDRKEVLGKTGKSEKLKPLYFTFLEYASLARKDKAFYERVEKDRIRLI